MAFLPVAAYVDEIDDAGDIGLTYFSPRFEELTGIAPRSIGANAWSWDDHVHPDDVAAYRESFERLWHAGRDQDVEYRFERGPDDWIWLRDQASSAYDPARHVTVIHGTLSDVTRRREAELEARRAHDELEATVRTRTEELRAALDELRAQTQWRDHAERVAHVGSWSWDLATQKAAWSSEMYRLFGVEPGEFEGDSTAILEKRVHPDDWEALQRATARVLETGIPVPVEYRVTLPDGTQRILHGEGTPELDAAGAVVSISGFYQDVTELRRTEEELRAREAAFQSLMASVDELFVRYGLDLRYRYVSPAMEELMGLPPAHFIGKTHREAGFPDELADFFDETLRRALRERTKISVEFSAPTPSGDRLADAVVYPELGPDGEPVAVVTVTRDITDMREAERELARRADEYASLLRTTSEGFWRTDSEGRILEVNDAFCRMSGYSRDELLGMSIPDLEAAEDPAATARHLQRFVSAGYKLFESRHRAKGGRLYDVEVSASFSPATGEVQAFFRDITARKRADAEIRRLNAELEAQVTSRTTQLEAANSELEALAYSIAHDVRAPLRAIDGFSALVLEEEAGRLGDETIAHLTRVREATRRLSRLIDDLLGLSQVSRRDMHREAVDLSRLAEEVAAELRRERPDRRVEVTVEPGLTADADPVLTRLILHKLLSNAWKFTAPHANAHVEVGSLEDDGERAFFVRDDGVGFDMRFAGHLFGAFQRMHPQGTFEGQGIGLATVQRLVRRHGGRCWAEAEPEKGATFFFTLAAPTAD